MNSGDLNPEPVSREPADSEEGSTSASASGEWAWADDVLHPNHLRLIQGSAISPEVARARGYRTVNTKAELERLGFASSQRGVPALLIPIHDVHGEIATYQARPDEPRLVKGKAVKYETPAGSTLVLDVSPAARSMLGDPRIPLFITEGVRKTDAAVSIGLCCIGLIGVWGWRGTNEAGGKTVLADWESITLKDRVIYIAFDSDVMTKREVFAALDRLREFLKSRGAVVSVIYLPAGEHGEKVGLDDFFAAGHTVEDLLALASTELRPPPKKTRSAPHEPTAGKPIREKPAAGGEAGSLPPTNVSAELAGDLLEDIVALIQRHIVISDAGALAAAVWVLHTHAFEAADYTPYLFIKSATRRCGKSHLLDLLALLVPRPITTANTTVPALFRTITEESPTVFFDEQDGLRGDSGDESENLRKILNAGFERGRTVRRCVGQKQQVMEFDVFCPKALASIGDLPDTVMDRALTIELKRKAHAEKVERFRRRKAEPLATPLREKAAQWAEQHLAVLESAQPDLPEELDDRAQDIAEPLLAIADLAGGVWPARVREAIIELRGGDASDDGDVRIRLLADIWDAYDAAGADWFKSAELVEALTADDSSPWRDWSRGDPIRPAGLARQLKYFKIRPQLHQVGGVQARGYFRRQFEDAFARYLTPPTPPPTSTCQPVNSGSNNQAKVDTLTGSAGEEAPAEPNALPAEKADPANEGSNPSAFMKPRHDRPSSEAADAESPSTRSELTDEEHEERRRLLETLFGPRRS